MSMISDNRFVRQVSLRALFSSLLVIGAPSTTRAEAPPAADEPQAKDLFVQGKHLEAAVAYEGLWARKQESRFLFNAAMARELSGHELQAFVHLQRYLTDRTLSAEERTAAEDRLRALKLRTKTLRVLISPATVDTRNLAITLQRADDGSASDLGRPRVVVDGDLLAATGVTGYEGALDLSLEAGEWTLEAASDSRPQAKAVVPLSENSARAEVVLKLAAPDSTPVTVPITATFSPSGALSAGIDVTIARPEPGHGRGGPGRETVKSASRTWHLAPGAWTLEARAPRYRATRINFLASKPSEFHVRLHPERNIAALSIGLLGGAALVSGAIVTTIYQNRWSDKYDAFIEVPEDSDDVADAKEQAANVLPPQMEALRKSHLYGATTLGIGGGLGVGAVLLRLEARFAHPGRIWASEAIVGAGLAALSLGLTRSFANPKYRDAMDAAYCDIENYSTDQFCKDQEEYLQSARTVDPPVAVTRAGAGAFFGGVGIGLFISGCVSLINSRISTKNRSRYSLTTAGDRLVISF